MSTHAITFLFADGVTQTALAAAGQTLAEAAQIAGLSLMTDCGNGQCGTCSGQCLSGAVEMQGHDASIMSAQEVDEGGVLCCVARVVGPAVVQLPYDASDACAGEEVFHSAQISRLSPLASDLYEFELVPDGENSAQALAFIPGQYVRLRWEAGDAARAYSMASAVGDAALKFCLRVVPGGAFSDWLTTQARIGSQVEFSAARGQFFLRDDTGPKVMVAGGSGLAPFLSMLRTLALEPSTPQAQAPMTLIVGARTPAHWFERDELAGLCEFLPNLNVDWVAEAGAEDGAYAGYPSDRLADVLMSTKTPASQSSVYVCGPPAMVNATQAVAMSAGVSKARVIVERFN